MGASIHLYTAEENEVLQALDRAYLALKEADSKLRAMQSPNITVLRELEVAVDAVAYCGNNALRLFGR